MKKSVSIMMIVAFIILLCTACGTDSPAIEGSSSDSNDVVYTLSDIDDYDVTSAYASYDDYADNFTELSGSAVLVVEGTVTSTVQKSPITQTASIAVDNVFLGDTFETITLYQMASDAPVKIGSKYIFFLNQQFPEDADSDVFYPIGGGQGILEIDNIQKNIIVNSANIMGDDLEAWLSSQQKNRSITITDYEVVLRSDIVN